MKKLILLSVICIISKTNSVAQTTISSSQNLSVEASQPQTLFATVTGGINEATLEKAIKIFPNPAINDINIKLQEGYDLSFSELFVSDVSGKIVFHEKNPSFKNGSYTLNVKGFEDGIYTLTLQTKNNKSQVNNKFIIRK